MSIHGFQSVTISLTAPTRIDSGENCFIDKICHLLTFISHSHILHALLSDLLSVSSSVPPTDLFSHYCCLSQAKCILKYFNTLLKWLKILYFTANFNCNRILIKWISHQCQDPRYQQKANEGASEALRILVVVLKL